MADSILFLSKDKFCWDFRLNELQAKRIFGQMNF